MINPSKGPIGGIFPQPSLFELNLPTQTGFSRSFMAVPSARNSGFDRMSNRAPGFSTLLLRTLSTACAVLTGTVDFSTMILGDLSPDARHTAAIRRAASSCDGVEIEHTHTCTRRVIGYFTHETQKDE